ncbi:MAG: hypothetical protein ACR2LN_02720 [Candidatus Levyibacteriota bacterium]
MKTVTRKKAKKTSISQTKRKSAPKNLIIVLSLVVVLFLTIISLQQPQDLRQEAATVPSPACMGSCPTIAPTNPKVQAPGPINGNSLPVPSGIGQQGQGGQAPTMGGQQNIIAMLINLLQSLIGGKTNPGIGKGIGGGRFKNGIGPISAPGLGGGTGINGGLGGSGTSGTSINGLPGINGVNGSTSTSGGNSINGVTSTNGGSSTTGGTGATGTPGTNGENAGD